MGGVSMPDATRARDAFRGQLRNEAKVRAPRRRVRLWASAAHGGGPPRRRPSGGVARSNHCGLRLREGMIPGYV